MHRVSILIALILGLIVAGPAVAQDPAATPAPVLPADVPTYRGNAARTSEQPGPGPAGQPVELWRVEVGVEFRASLAMASGVLYAAGMDGTMHALDPATGAERWAFPTGGQNAKFPTVADGDVFFGSGDGVFYAVDAVTGAERWRLPDVGDDPGALVVDGTLYVSADAGLLALDAATGAERWRYTAGGSAESPTERSVLAPAFAGGVVYASAGLQLVALNADDGAVIWSFPVEGGRLNPPFVAGGIVYLGNPDADEVGGISYLYALDAATGAERWRFSVSDDVYGGAVGGGKVYAPAGDGAIYGIDAAGGASRWRFATGAADFGVWPVIVGDTLYVAADDGILSAVDAANGVPRWSLDIGVPSQSPVITGGVIYVPLRDGAVIALGDPSAATGDATGGATPPATADTPEETPVELLWVTRGGPTALTYSFLVVVAPNGTIWVADGDRQYQIFDSSGAYLETWEPTDAGEIGSVGRIAFDLDGGFYVNVDRRILHYDRDRRLVKTFDSQGTGDGQFIAPVQPAVDAAGNLYVGDEGRLDIQVFDPAGNFVRVLGGPESPSMQFSGYFGAIVFDADGNLLVTDERHPGIRKFTPDGALLTTIGGAGSGDGEIQQASWIALDADGKIFANDVIKHRVVVFDAGGQYLGEWGSFGTADGQFAGPDGVALDGQGNAYVADFQTGRVQKFRLLPPLAPATGETAQTGEPAEFLWQTTGGPEALSTFYVAVAPDGTVWANNIGKGRFQIFDGDGRYLDTWAPDGVRPDSTPVIAFGPEGVIYVTEGVQIHKYGADRNLITAWGSQGDGDGQSQNITGIGVDAAGNVYVCDEFRQDVQKFDADGRFLAKWGGPGTGEGQFAAGAGYMDVDAEGNSYVFDYGNARVQVFSPDGAFLRSFGEDGDVRLGNPGDVAIDQDGNVFVTMYGQSKVQVFDATGRFLTSWGDFGPGEGQLLSTDGIALDGQGNVYVADSAAGRIVKFRLLPPLD